MQTSSERRIQSSARIAYGLPIALSHEGYHEPFEAECVDLSPGGLSLRASCLPGVGELLTCHFSAPEAGQRVEVRGEVVWAHLEGQRGGEFGVRFIDESPTTIALISEMIGECEAMLCRDSDVAAKNPQADAKLSVDGTTDTFTARLLRRDPGLVTFEQDLSFLKLGRGVSAYQGDDVQRGEIASVAVRLDGSVPKLMVTLRYADSALPDDAHTRDEAVTTPHIEKISAKDLSSAPAAIVEPTTIVETSLETRALNHDTVPDLNAPSEREREASGKHAVTLTEFDAAFRTREHDDSGSDLPEMSTRSEFDLPSAIEEAESLLPPAPANVDEEDEGPALFTADEPIVSKAPSIVNAPAIVNAPPLATTSEAITANELEATTVAPRADAKLLNDGDEALEDIGEDERYELAAARMLGDRPATLPMTTDATQAGADATVERCDPALMFKVDQSDEDFRLPKQPSALTVAAGVLLSLINQLRALSTSLSEQLRAKLVPWLQAQLGGVSTSLAPKAIALWTRAKEQALPLAKSALKRVTGAAQNIASKVGTRSKPRRTTAMPAAQTTAAPTVNRRSQVTPAQSKPRAQMLVLGVLALGGVGLAGYALFSAPDPNVVPVHREINAAAGNTVPQAVTSAPSSAIQDSNTTIDGAHASAIALPAAPSTLPATELPAAAAMPAPSYEAGRIAAPSYPTIERAAPVAPKPAPIVAATPAEPIAAQEGTGAATIESNVVTSNASASAQRFGASSVRGRHFTLQMSAPVRGITGTADAGGFSIVIEGALSLDRAGPIAANHADVARAMILNKGDRAELTIRFKDGRSPKYQVLGKGDHIEITIEE